MNFTFFNHLLSVSGLVPNKIIVSAAEAERNGIELLMQHLLAELPDMLMAAVVEVGNGRALATYTCERNYRVSTAVSHNAEIIRQTQSMLRALSLTGEEVEEVLITLPSQAHLIRLFPDNRQRFVYLAVDCRDTNLAIAREVVRQGMQHLTEAALTAG